MERLAAELVYEVVASICLHENETISSKMFRSHAHVSSQTTDVVEQPFAHAILFFLGRQLRVGRWSCDFRDAIFDRAAIKIGAERHKDVEAYYRPLVARR